MHRTPTDGGGAVGVGSAAAVGRLPSPATLLPAIGARWFGTCCAAPAATAIRAVAPLVSAARTAEAFRLLLNLEQAPSRQPVALDTPATAWACLARG